jgi:glucosylceramidase
MTKRNIRIFLTARNTADRLTEQAPLSFEPDLRGVENELINVFEDVEFQTVQGFGGAFTEAAAVTLQKMSPEKQREIVKAYFSPESGHGYTFCRTHIHSCDFALDNYTYVEPGDRELKTFSVERDRSALIPFIREAMRTAGTPLTLFASPWSPPDWMKSNGQMNGGGKLLPEYRESWADYFVKYIRAYEEEGIAIWGVTAQNEPNAAQSWDSCLYTAEEERDFVRDCLGPALERAGLGHVRIIVWDHNKERIYDRAKTILSDPAANRYVYGVGFHWYSGDHFEGLAAVQRKYPDKALIFTEGCVAFHEKTGPWESGEQYGHDILGNLNHGMSAWTDWNLLLDERGGPNHVANFCSAPIMADTQTDTIYYQSSFYYIGHFSRFIRPGAVRIGFSRYTDRLETTAFRNPDGSVAVVVMNRTDEEIPFVLRTEHGIVETASPAHSIQTMVY